MGVSVAYLPKSHINNYYHGVIVFEKIKNQICNAQNRRYGEMVHLFLRHIQVLSCHMERICFRQHLELKWQQCVHIHNKTIHYHIGNVFCIVASNVHICILQVQNQINTIQMLDPPYDFMYINAHNVVLCMVDYHLIKINCVNCVRLLKIQ